MLTTNVLFRGIDERHVCWVQGLLQVSGRKRGGGTEALLNVNNKLVLPSHELSDGDLVIMSDELLSF